MDYSWLILTCELSLEDCDGRDWEAVQSDWKHLRSLITDGDQIWEYECSIDDRNPLSGTSGVCIKRGDTIVSHIVTSRILYR